MSTRICIRRRQALFQDIVRDYTILVDGREVARVANGAEVAVWKGKYLWLRPAA
ncbi:MAG: hypothetical protein ACJ8GW_09985 [Massilia sp.]